MTSREEDGATLRLLETTGRSQERPRRSVRRTLRQPKRGRATVGEVLGVPSFLAEDGEGAHYGATYRSVSFINKATTSVFSLRVTSH
jgi:hypothetical protein